MRRIARDEELFRRLRPKMMERARVFDIHKIVGEWEKLFLEAEDASSKRDPCVMTGDSLERR